MAAEVINTEKLLMQSTTEDLEPLVGFILKASISEGLSKKERYQKHQPHHEMYPVEILNEIRLFGGNTFANAFRSVGPSYLDVVRDAAKKVGVKKVKNLSLIELEQQMIETLLRKALKRVSGEDKEELEQALYEAGLQAKDLRSLLSGGSLAAALTAPLYRSFMLEGSKLIANAVSKQMLQHGIRIVGSSTASRALGFLAGPVGWIVTGIWTATDIAGPGYRVTVPCSLHIAMLRQKWLYEQEVKELRSAFTDA